MPLLVIDLIEYGPPEFAELLPVRCEVVRTVHTADGVGHFVARPLVAPVYVPLPPSPITPELDEYYTSNVYPRLESFDLRRVKEELLHQLPDGRIGVTVPGFVLTPRFPSAQTLGPDMTDTWVNLAFVLDPAMMRESDLNAEALFFSMIARVNVQQDAPVTLLSPTGHQPSKAPVGGVGGPVRYLEFADRMGERAGYVWIGLTDDTNGAILPENPVPATTAAVSEWTEALRAGRDAGIPPETLLSQLQTQTASILSGPLTPTAIADAPGLLTFSLSAGRQMADRNRKQAGIVSYGKPPQEFSTLMLPTPAEQERIDTMLAEAINARDTVPAPNGSPDTRAHSAGIDQAPPTIGEQAR